MTHAIFHLSLPVDSLETAQAFYCGLLGAPLGRQTPEWIDVLLFGHQLTLHARPDEVLPPHAQGVRHFGAILPWSQWQSLAARLQAAGVDFVMPPTMAHEGTADEQGKLLLRDPSGHLVEIKAYRDAPRLFGAATS